MLGVATFVAVLIATVNAVAFTDLNCTNLDATNSKFVASATNCENKYPTAACATLFGTAVVDLGAVDRDAKCNKDAAGVSQRLKQLAITSCAKHCGYCCETPEYKCDNKLIPRVKCETVTPTQCNDPLWKAILAEDCPKSCGLCVAGGCVDKAMECASDPAICKQVNLQVFVKANCQRTCGFCEKDSGGGGVNCTDSSASCAVWNRNGFCASSFYSETQRRQYCAKTCNLC